MPPETVGNRHHLTSGLCPHTQGRGREKRAAEARDRHNRRLASSTAQHGSCVVPFTRRLSAAKRYHKPRCKGRGGRQVCETGYRSEVEVNQPSCAVLSPARTPGGRFTYPLPRQALPWLQVETRGSDVPLLLKFCPPRKQKLKKSSA